MSLIKFNRPKSWLDFPGFAQDLLNTDSLMNALDSVGTLPAVNVKETNDNYVMEFAAPGYQREDFSIETNEGSLVVKGLKQEEKTDSHSYTRKEFSYSSFSRMFELPETVDEDKISASYKDGILTVSLPKKEEAKPKAPRKIAVK